jgi:hypothetical protein
MDTALRAPLEFFALPRCSQMCLSRHIRYRGGYSSMNVSKSSGYDVVDQMLRYPLRISFLEKPKP